MSGGQTPAPKKAKRVKPTDMKRRYWESCWHLPPFSVPFLVMRLIGVCDSTTQAFGTYVEQSLHQNLRESFNSFLLAPLDQTKTYGKLHFVSAKDSTDVSQ
jgi:hypothetical protein